MFALTQSLRRAVQTRPNGVSTIFGATRRTWMQTADRVARIAGALSALGVRRGDRIAILALNSDRYFELLYAVPWIGAVAVPQSTVASQPALQCVSTLIAWFGFRAAISSISFNPCRPMEIGRAHV